MEKIQSIAKVFILISSLHFGQAQCPPYCQPLESSSINRFKRHSLRDKFNEVTGDTVPQQNDCPAGFTLYEASSKCYALINTLMDKDAHIAECSRLAVGAFIAAPLDAGENLFIQSLIQDQSTTEQAKCQIIFPYGHKWNYAYFLGVVSSERKARKNFQWRLSGGFRSKMVYNNFGLSRPNFGPRKEYCINYKDDFTWNVVDCSGNFCSVCEFRLQ